MKKEDYLNKLKTEIKLKGHSQHTLRAYSRFLERFLHRANPKTMTLDDVKSRIANLTDTYTTRSLSQAMSSVKFFFAHIIDRPEIYAKLKLPKKQKTLPVVLTKQEVKDLIKATKFQKTFLIINLLYGCGFRVSEVVNLKPTDLDFSENSGWVREGKGKKDRLFKIPEKISTELKEYIESQPNNKYLFSESEPLSSRNIQYLIDRATKKAQLKKKVTPHTLRHSFATHLYESGEDLLVIQRLLGHENLETTKIYTHVSQERIKRVRSPLDSL
ncbi:MAG: site-specific tyrosine recombinase/integron integrase [Candidatus Woesearchaeota archaeon]